MSHDEQQALDVTVDDVQRLARLAGLPLNAAEATLLAPLLAADLRVIQRLRACDAGEMPPVNVLNLSQQPGAGSAADNGQ